MTEVAHTTVDASGHYTLNRPTQRAGAGEGDAPGRRVLCGCTAERDGTRYYRLRRGPKVDGVFIEADVLELEVDNGQLHVIERYFVHNTSMPPRTQWSPKSFEVVLPAEAIVESAQGQRPSTGSLPTTLKLQPNGPKGHYAFNFPIQPDEGDKDTQFKISYTIPYSGSFTFHPQVTLSTQSVGVLLPKSMTFTPGAGSAFTPINQDPNIQTFVAKNATPGKALGVYDFRHGIDAARRSGRSRPGGPEALRRWWRPTRRRHRRAHQHTRSAQQVQVVDSRRTGAGLRSGCGFPAAQACGSAGVPVAQVPSPGVVATPVYSYFGT